MKKSTTPRLWIVLAGIAAVTLILGAMGCGQLFQPGPRIDPAAPSCSLPLATYHESILDASYSAADRLAEILAARGSSLTHPFVAASFVNIDDLSETCTLGRVIPEQMASRLAQHGVRFIELKLRHHSLYIKSGDGEFALSRELREIGQNSDIFAILVGTYAKADDTVFISTRIVLVEDSSVIAGHDYELSRGIVPVSFLK